MHLISENDIQYSVHTPHPFLQERWPRLLPDWSEPIESLLVVLQYCPCSLWERTEESERYKDMLRDRFLQLGEAIYSPLTALGYQVDWFDPRTGHPLLSSPGSLRLDDVAIVHAALGYATVDRGNCSLILHPHWGSAVYPATLVSSAPHLVLAQMVSQLQQLTPLQSTLLRTVD